MGVGDELMASGHALSEHRRTGRRVKILDLRLRPRWDTLWEGLPWIAKPHEIGRFAKIRNGPQCRPYIAYPFSRLSGQRFTQWRARDHVGAIAFTDAEMEFAEQRARSLGPFILLEPNIARKGNPNKQWGSGKWRELAAALRPFGPVVQMGPRGTKKLTGAVFVETESFRLAAALLTKARLSVLPEGGLHHAAGVTRSPAVVLFPGTISPETTGYDDHINLWSGVEPCGSWIPCRHCRDLWTRLSARDVAAVAVRALTKTEVQSVVAPDLIVA